MKKIELKNGVVVYYGTLEEIKKAAQEQETMLPNEMKKFDIDVDVDTNGKVNIFTIQVENKDDKKKVIKLIATAILKRILFEISGEEIGEDECYNQSCLFVDSILRLEREIYDWPDMKK